MAEKLFNISAQDLRELKINNKDEHDRILNQCRFLPYIYRLRIKAETNNDDTKVRYNALKIDEIDYKTETRNLLTAIQNY